MKRDVQFHCGDIRFALEKGFDALYVGRDLIFLGDAFVREHAQAIGFNEVPVRRAVHHPHRVVDNGGQTAVPRCADILF